MSCLIPLMSCLRFYLATSFYIIYVNDIRVVMKFCSFSMYLDGTKIVTEVDPKEDILIQQSN